jgi:thiamine biosynthesis lipoprotein
MHRLTESIRALAGAFLAALALGACAPSEPWRQESYVFGTRVEVLIFGTAQDEARAASAQVLQDFDRLHRQYHAWQESDLTRLNTALAAGRPASVSPELAGLIAQAQLLAHESDYLFDPAIGQLIALWGFQSDSPKAELPRSAAIDSLVKRRPASADLRIDGTTVSSRNPAVALDFGGYLKGVALDRAALTLRAHGIQNALINIGGNILALGSKGGVPWRVGIAHPRPERVGGVPLAALDLHDGEAIGTSGDYHRFFEVEGKRYFHLLDPRTGRPAFGTMAVTVLVSPGRDTGARSDALSKPLFIAGKDWPALAKKMNLPTVLRVADDGSLELSPAMKARLSMEATDTRIVVRE